MTFAEFIAKENVDKYIEGLAESRKDAFLKMIAKIDDTPVQEPTE